MSNHIDVTGNITQPELKYSQNGKAFCRFAVIDQKRKKDDQGQWQDASDPLFIRITLWGDDAEAAANTLNKGDRVTATGQVIVRKFTAQDGTERESIELDFPTVAKVIRAPRASGTQAPPMPPQGDPWATQAPQQGSQPQQWGPNNATPEPPF